MSNFLVNLVRRGAGLQHSVVPRALADMSSAAVTDSEDIQELVAEELLSGPVEPTTHIELGRSSDTASEARRTEEQSEVSGPSNSASARLEEMPVSHGSDGETPRRNTSQQSTRNGLIQEGLESATSPVPLPEDLHRQLDDSAHVSPTGQPTYAAETRPDHMHPLAPDNFAETSDPHVEPRVDFIVVQEQHSIGEPAVTKVSDQPRVTPSREARHIDDVSGPASQAARLQPQPQVDHGEDTVARPSLEMLPFSVDRERNTSASNNANQEIDGLIERMEALIDRFEANQTASQRPPFHHLLQPRQRPPARGFGELASLRRHAARRWY